MGDVWNQFQALLFQALLYLEGVTHDWGMAIILLTLGIRLVLLPLTWKQTKSMAEMQKIQPQLKAVQAKYKDDKEKQQAEMLKLYSDNKVSPFGGCLPLLLQFPVLIALYSVLGGRAGKPGLMLQYLAKHGETGTFYHVLKDLSLTPQAVWQSGDYLSFIPYILLVVLFAVSIWLPQALMPGDKQQKMIGGYMAVLMLYFGWVSPAGVLLYWDVSSLWGVVQQQVTLSMNKSEEAAGNGSSSETAPEAVAGKKPANEGSKKKKKS